MVDGVTSRKERIREFFRPIVIDHTVFHGYIVFIGGKGIPLVLDFVEASSKQIDFVAKVSLKPPCKLQPLPVPLAHRLG